MNTIKVIAISWWHYGQDCTATGGLSSQVTKCEHDGQVFYVRENSNGIASFNISSGERWGDKRGAKPRGTRQILELACRPGDFDFLAKWVAENDQLGRSVKLNRQFTRQWAEYLFTRHPHIVMPVLPPPPDLWFEP